MMVQYCSVVGVLLAGRWRCASSAVAAVRAWQPNGVAGVSGGVPLRRMLRQLVVNPWVLQCRVYTS
jgi:hypothetical protein